MDDWPKGAEKLSFVNCPFADSQAWIEKAVRELEKGAASILFVPAILNSVYFRESVYPRAAEIHFFTVPIKCPGKEKQLPVQTCLLIFAGRDPEIPDKSYPLLFRAEVEGWEEEYYKRPRNKSRFAPKK